MKKEHHFTKATTMEKAHPAVLTGIKLKSTKVALRLWFHCSKFNYQDETSHHKMLFKTQEQIMASSMCYR